jgi:DNA-directed RNA polymerase specialized sigma24 family protein
MENTLENMENLSTLKKIDIIRQLFKDKTNKHTIQDIIDEKLSEKQELAFGLRVFENYSNVRISKVLKCNKSNVTRLFKIALNKVINDERFKKLNLNI